MTGRTVRQAAADRANLPAQVTRTDAIAQIVERHQATIAASLPIGWRADRFSRLLLTASSTSPKLLECDPRSFLAAGVTAAQLGLEPNDPRGLAYLVPRKGRVTLVLGYPGLMELALRSGRVGGINAFAVYDGDDFNYHFGLNPDVHHIPDPDGDEDPAKLTHAYAIATVNGSQVFRVLSRRRIEKARKSSTADTTRSDSPWTQWYEQMALKTALRALCRFLPKSAEMARALDVDNRTLTIGDLETIAGFADDPTDLTADEDVIEANHSGPTDDERREWAEEMAAGMPDPPDADQ